ncbi:MAG: CatA-like O-acetyltransferase, partial [Anaerolineae bacterium]|nr:CatA-like O-acetyltransferase [Anaerolineae bacterium]
MAYIDQSNWARRDHFELFNSFDWPHFGLSANVDITRFMKEVKARGISVNVAIVYVMARTANEIPEFRQRIREKGVFEHKVVHPSTTIMGKDERFSFCA